MLVITTQESGRASVAETRAWQEKVPRSELVVLPGDSFHAAASDADACAAGFYRASCHCAVSASKVGIICPA